MDGCAKYSLGCINLCGDTWVDTGLPAYADGEHVVKVFQSGVGTNELRMLYVAGENIVLPQHIFNENTLVEFSIFTPDGEHYSPAFAGLDIPENASFTFTTQKYPVTYA